MSKISQITADFPPALRLILSVHEAVPGVTESILAGARTADGRSSYEILHDAAGLLAGNTVLDLACGSGCLTELLASRVGSSGRVIGVDLSQGELDLAHRRLSTAGNVQLLCAAAADLPLPDEAVDAVFCHMALMLFSPVAPVIAEIARVLRPGGILVAMIPSPAAGDPLFMQIRRALATQLEREVPAADRVPLGDAAMGSIEEIRRVFAGNESFSQDLRWDEVDVALHDEPAVLAARLLPFFYHSHLLSSRGKDAVKREWYGILKRPLLNADAAVTLTLPLAVLTAIKQS